MSLFNDCPDCGNSLTYRSNRCRCGWKISNEIAKNETGNQCLYVSDGVRCESDGTISPRRLSGKWFCSEHWHEALTTSYKS